MTKLLRGGLLARSAFVMAALVLTFCSTFLLMSMEKAHAASCGSVQVVGSRWAGGNGVDVHSNGADDGTVNSCGGYVTSLTASPPQWGWAWQCVELAARMYKTHGWNFPSVDFAYQIFTKAGSVGDTTMSNGSITLSGIVPGDMLVTHEGKYGHVMLVDYVSGSSIYAVDQNGKDGGRSTVTFSNGYLRDGSYQFSGVVHSPSDKLGTPHSDPVTVSRASTNMAVFYNDGNGGLVNWSWDVNSGWSSYTWHDTFGTDVITGQPCAVVRDANNMDVFYRTVAGRLIHRGWNVTNGWEGPDVLISSDDIGGPTCVSRDSGDLQAFYRTSEGEIKSVSWNWQTGWNLNPQRLYTSGATGDPLACSRSSDSMEVFFGKNNGNLVHLGWTSEYGWITQDWSAGAGVTGKPSCISRNGGADMSADYQESNGRLGEEFWNWQTGWNWQDWNAQLVGSPSAIPGVAYPIEVFYRETGGNIVDHSFNGTSWVSNWIVGAGGATGNPYAIVRGSNEDVFYWNHSTLMDADWNATKGWTTAPVR